MGEKEKKTYCLGRNNRERAERGKERRQKSREEKKRTEQGGKKGKEREGRIKANCGKNSRRVETGYKKGIEKEKRERTEEQGIGQEGREGEGGGRRRRVTAKYRCCNIHPRHSGR